MTTSIKNLSFEDALQELETIVRRLEEGQVPLEEAIQSYERGAALRHHCEIKLKEAKLRIEKISLSPTGEEVVEPFKELAS
jgi:exodeoxyribonuclease VII small subunit